MKLLLVTLAMVTALGCGQVDTNQSLVKDVEGDSGADADSNQAALLTSPKRLQRVLEPQDDYYMVRKQRISLKPDLTQVAIFFASEPKSFDHLIGNAIDTEKLATLPKIARANPYYYTVVPRTALRSQEELEQFASEGKLPHLVNIYSTTGGRTMAMPSLSVAFNSADQTEQATAELEAMGLAVVEYPSEKSVKLRLKANSEYADEFEATHAIESRGFAFVKWVSPDLVSSFQTFPGMGVRN